MIDRVKAATGGGIIAAGVFGAYAGYRVGATGGLTKWGALSLGLVGVAAVMVGMLNRK